VLAAGRRGVVEAAVAPASAFAASEWDEQNALVRHVNEFWVRPSAEEPPPQARIVENACYWCRSA
jgi:hypothetical protein